MFGIKFFGCDVNLLGVNVKFLIGQIFGFEIKGGLKGLEVGFYGVVFDISVKGFVFNMVFFELDFGINLKGLKIKGGVDVLGGVSVLDISFGEGYLSVKGFGGEWKGF